MVAEEGDKLINIKTGEVFRVKIVRAEMVLLEREDSLRLESMCLDALRDKFEKFED